MDKIKAYLEKTSEVDTSHFIQVPNVMAYWFYVKRDSVITKNRYTLTNYNDLSEYRFGNEGYEGIRHYNENGKIELPKYRYFLINKMSVYCDNSETLKLLRKIRLNIREVDRCYDMEYSLSSLVNGLSFNTLPEHLLDGVKGLYLREGENSLMFYLDIEDDIEFKYNSVFGIIFHGDYYRPI